MDPGKKSSFDVKELRNQDQLVSFDEIKQALTETIGSLVGDIGYICPGHGMKGRKCSLQNDDDVEEMYSSEYKNKRHVLLWCYLATSGTVKQKGGKKRKHEDEGDSASQSKQTASQSKQTVAQKKLQEIEEIIAKLKEKHGNGFKVEHLNAWAHLIQVGKHSSYDNPPNYPYFTGCRSSQTSSKDDTEGGSAGNPGKTDPSVLSPGNGFNFVVNV